MQLTMPTNGIDIAIKLKKVIYWVVSGSLILIAWLVVVSTGTIPGNYKLYTVQSGSMQPDILKGSIVFTKPQSKYVKGDIITVQEPDNLKMTITHRIVEIKKNGANTMFVTKGDANKTADTEIRLQENVIGKVLLSIPYIGYLASFAKTQTGLIALVVIPATIIIYSELMTIKNEAIKLLRERKKRKLSLIENAEVAVGMEIMDVQDELKSAEKKIENKILHKKNKKKK